MKTGSNTRADLFSWLNTKCTFTNKSPQASFFFLMYCMSHFDRQHLFSNLCGAWISLKILGFQIIPPFLFTLYPYPTTGCHIHLQSPDRISCFTINGSIYYLERAVSAGFMGDFSLVLLTEVMWREHTVFPGQKKKKKRRETHTHTFSLTMGMKKIV